MEEKKTQTVCPYAKKCGGCQYQGVPYSAQLKKKQSQGQGLLKKFGNVKPVIGMKDPYFYRNKVHAVFDRDRKGNIISGIYEAGTHRVVSIEQCLIEDKKSQEIIRTIRGMLKSFKIKTYDEDTGYGLLRHVLVRRGFSTGEVMVVLVVASPIFPSKNNFVKALRKVHPEISTVVLNINDKNTSMVLGEREIAVEFAGLTGKEKVIDAYCGIGTIGLVASGKAREVVGVELNKDAVRDARINARENKVVNISFRQGDAGEFMEAMAEAGEKADVVFMDPPRSGSSEKFLNSVIKLSPKKIVYISCNPETLARDLNFLTRKNYIVKEIQPVEMFCFTDHTEVVTWLEQK